MGLPNTVRGFSRVRKTEGQWRASKAIDDKRMERNISLTGAGVVDNLVSQKGHKLSPPSTQELTISGMAIYRINRGKRAGVTEGDRGRGGWR